MITNENALAFPGESTGVAGSTEGRGAVRRRERVALGAGSLGLGV